MELCFKNHKTPGKEIKFTVRVNNDVPKTAKNIIANTIMPKGWVIHFNPSKGSFNKKTGIWKIGNIKPNENASAQSQQKKTNTEITSFTLN